MGGKKKPAPKKAKGKGKKKPAPKKAKGKGKVKKKSRARLLGDAVTHLYNGLRVVEKHVTYDKTGKCDYKPPAGCGCEGTTLPQQTQPRELGEAADPTNKGDCPAMPAGCMCRVAARADLVSMLDEDHGDLFTAKMYDGIVCRIRTAVNLAQTKFPSQFTKFKASATFQNDKKQIGGGYLAPLLACVQDEKQSDATCATYLPQLMDEVDLTPAVSKLQHAMGA